MSENPIAGGQGESDKDVLEHFWAGIVSVHVMSLSLELPFSPYDTEAIKTRRATHTGDAGGGNNA